MRAVLDKSHDIFEIKNIVYSEDERAALVPIASARPPAPVPMEPRALRTALAGLMHMRMKDSGAFGGKLMLASYQNRLAEFPSEAICHACRVWLDNEHFFPDITDLRALAREWISPEQKLINRARYILRWGGKPREPLPPPTESERSAFNGQMRRLGLSMRYFDNEAEPRNIEDGEGEPYCIDADLELSDAP